MLSSLYEYFLDLTYNFRSEDIVDIFLTAVVIYWILRLIRGTRAFYMLVGICVGLFMVWITSSQLVGLVSVNWILKSFFSHLPLIIIVLFQAEIRKAFAQLGKGTLFSKVKAYAEDELIDELVRTAAELADRKTGALIVIEREADLSSRLDSGVSIYAKVSKELLLSIFNSKSPIHDGAVLIQNGRITRAAALLPISLNPSIHSELGTRHRAALGLAEEVDSIIIVISEERGTICVAFREKLSKDLTPKALRSMLVNVLNPQIPKKSRLSFWTNRDKNES